MSKEELLKKSEYGFDDLCEIVEILRAPNGCPWDREQTHASIRKSLIEETYEAVEGIDADSAEMMCEELGDLLLQIVFHASIAKDENEFDIKSICTGICRKLIYRHPHVFSDVSVESSDEVLKNWDELKKKEKGQKSSSDVLLSVSRALPSLMRAQKLSKKSGEQNEINELCDRISHSAQLLKSDFEKSALGSLMFDIARLGNIKKCDLEQVLYNENEHFCENHVKNS